MEHFEMSSTCVTSANIIERKRENENMVGQWPSVAFWQGMQPIRNAFSVECEALTVGIAATNQISDFV